MTTPASDADKSGGSGLVILTAVIAAVVVGAVGFVVLRSGSPPSAQPTLATASTVRGTLKEISTSTTIDEHRSSTVLLTTTTTTTSTIPEAAGTIGFVANMSYGADGWPFPPLQNFPAFTPTLTWQVNLTAGQHARVTGPAPGNPTAQLSTLPSGQYTLCPGTITPTSNGPTCFTPAGTYTYTLDVLDESNQVVSSMTADLRVSG